MVLLQYSDERSARHCSGYAVIIWTGTASLCPGHTFRLDYLANTEVNEQRGEHRNNWGGGGNSLLIIGTTAPAPSCSRNVILAKSLKIEDNFCE